MTKQLTIILQATLAEQESYHTGRYQRDVQTSAFFIQLCCCYGKAAGLDTRFSQVTA